MKRFQEKTTILLWNVIVLVIFPIMIWKQTEFRPPQCVQNSIFFLSVFLQTGILSSV